MVSFELNAKFYCFWERIKKEVLVLLLLLAVVFILVGFQLSFFTAVIFAYSLLLMLKRNRIVTAVRFNDEEKQVYLEYYYFIFFRGKVDIPYRQLSAKFGTRRLGLGTTANSLEIFKSKILAVEIKQRGKWSWTENQINMIYEKLTSIQKFEPQSKRS